jgi:hypothetical protein
VTVPGVDFERETFHLVLLSRTGKINELDEATVDRLNSEHVRYNLKLLADGLMLAAGRVVDATSTRHVDAGGPLVGLGFWNIPREEVLRLQDSDPGVRAGLYTAELVQFRCPKGAIRFKEP